MFLQEYTLVLSLVSCWVIVRFVKKKYDYSTNNEHILHGHNEIVKILHIQECYLQCNVLFSIIK